VAIDVVDSDAIAKWVTQADEIAPLDLVIANAGVSAGTGTAGEPLDQAQHIMAINVDGVINMVHPMLGCLTARQDFGTKG
jgi:NADP-dependent 3-hydroxy acid dehydrogenase YdfG